MTAIAAMWSLLACQRFGPDKPVADDSGTVDTDDSGHSGTPPDDSTPPDTQETGETGDTPPIPLSTYVYEVERHVIEPTSLHLLEITYAVTSDNPRGGYRDNEGNDPLFHVVRPEHFTDAGAAHPALVWLHGGAQGYDDECPDPATIPEGEDDPCNFCRESGIVDLVENAITGHEFILDEIATREWMLVVPENNWCDLWAGLGEDDPVDTNHQSVVHTRFALDVLEEGIDDMLADPAALYIWGTSLGGSGTFPVAYGTGDDPDRFAGIVCDSGPMSMAWWDSDSPHYQPYIEHVTGGPAYDDQGNPTQWFDNYERLDGTLLVRDKGFRVPVFSAWNTFDQLTDVENGTQLEALLPDTYGADGVRYWSHDFNHHAPAGNHHTQTAYRKPPWGYTPHAAFEFLSGKHVAFYEAEDLCPATVCTIQAESGGDVLEAISIYSNGSATVHGGDDTAGTVFRGEIPAEVPRDAPMTIMLGLRAEDLAGHERTEPLLTASLKRDGVEVATKTVLVGDVEEGDDAPVERYKAHVDNTTWAPDLDGDGVGDALPEGALTLEVTHHGPGIVYFDGLWFLW